MGAADVLAASEPGSGSLPDSEVLAPPRARDEGVLHHVEGHHVEGMRIREATEADNDALCGLVGSIPFGGATQLVEERGGDFFALRRAEAEGHSEPIVLLVETAEGNPVGCLSCTVRPGRHGANDVPVGHLADIRLTADARGARVFPALTRLACELARDRYQTELFMTAVLEHDQRAIDAFIRRDARRFEQPMCQVMTLMDVVALPVGARSHGRPGRLVQRASAVDLQEMAALVARGQATRRFGRPSKAEAISARAAAWPGFGIDSFFVARDPGAAIVGAAAVWEPTPLRTFSMQGVTRPMRWQRSLFDLKAPLLGHRRLPPRGQPIRAAYVEFTEVARGDQGVVIDLVRGILADLEATPVQWLLVTVTRDTSTDMALASFAAFRIPLLLLAITPAGTPWNNVDFRTQRAGFELSFG